MIRVAKEDRRPVSSAELVPAILAMPADELTVALDEIVGACRTTADQDGEFAGAELAPVDAGTDGTRIGGKRIGNEPTGVTSASDTAVQLNGTRIGQ